MSTRQLAYAIAFLFLVNTLNFFDRQVIGALGEPIRREWGLDDKALGMLSTAFTLIYAAAGLPLGRLADLWPRKHLLGLGVLLWSVMTAASGLARGYTHLFLARLGVGVGEAVCAPAAASLIGDLYPAAGRGRALSIFMMGLPVGLALSYFVSGRVAAAHGWQAAFFVAGAPGIVLGLLAWWIPEPPRGPRAEAPPWWHGILTLLRRPTLLWVIVSGALFNFNSYVLGAFLVPYLMRFHALTIREAGDQAMLVSAAGVPGLLLGGIAADRALRRGQRSRLFLGAGASALSALCAYLALSLEPGSQAMVTAFLALQGALGYVYYSSVYPTIQDVVEPRLRGSAMALYFFAMYVCGAAFGPWATGALSDHLTHAAALRGGVTHATAAALEPFRAEGLRAAMHVVPLLGILLAVVLYGASRTVARDMERVGADR